MLEAQQCSLFGGGEGVVSGKAHEGGCWGTGNVLFLCLCGNSLSCIL